MAFLEGTQGFAEGRRFELHQNRWTLGRDEVCDIVVDVGVISRRHAQIVSEGGVFYIEDLHSRNGTFVNREPVAGRRRLNDQDELSIGDNAFVFRENPKQPAELGNSPKQNEVEAGSVILSKLESSVSQSSARLAVNPELKLRALLEITQHLARSRSLQDLLPRILESLFRVFNQADRGFILLQQDHNAPFLPVAKRYRSLPPADGSIRFCRGIVREALQHQQAILSAQMNDKAELDPSLVLSSTYVRSVMCAPMIDSRGQNLGVIQLETLSQQSPFQKSDLDLLASVAMQGALVIENANVQDHAIRQQVLEDDLRAARDVQKAFLPATRPAIAGYEFFDFYKPARAIGGDFFDYIEMPDGRSGVILGDVAGKGITAALLMAKVVAEAKYFLAAEHDPVRAVTRLNQSVERAGFTDKFVTFVLLLLNPRGNTVTVVNGGHMPPLHRRTDGSVEEVGATISSLPLGVDPTCRYEPLQMQLMPGESLILFTDGISEAMNAVSERYGLARIQQQLLTASSDAVNDLGPALLSDVTQFVGGSSQIDDMCVVCIGRA